MYSNAQIVGVNAAYNFYLNVPVHLKILVGNSKLKDSVRIYRLHIRQPKHEKLKVVERNLREMLKENSYTSGDYRAIHKIFFKQTLCSKKVIPTVPKKELFILLPYLGTMPSNLKRKLGTSFKNSLP